MPIARRMEPSIFEMPRFRAMARHALPRLVEATLIPLALFYGALWLVGIWGALATALLWSYGAIARRAIKGERIPGLLVLGAIGLTTRTAMAIATGSAFVYFLQPSLTTFGVAFAFLLSAAGRRPLAERLAADFCPLPDHWITRPVIRRLFVRITLLWALVQFANAAGAIWLLVSQPVDTYVISRTAWSWALTVFGIAASTVHFKRTLRRHGIAWKVAPVGP
jgi:hypothetical protein